MSPVVRVSILRCKREDFATLRQMMMDSLAPLEPGISKMPGFIRFYAGADEETSSLNNVSFWTSLEHAKQLDAYQPMLDLGREFVAKGATFERPVMNYTTLWEFPR
ncbi:MAG TPA: hypothetical protein VKX28_19345 [Xanthobacteraceae bacterium]|jgi:hypothetical protein|nr:hypothetical protein [Xanthobacteraceae bacterium]